VEGDTRIYVVYLKDGNLMFSDSAVTNDTATYNTLYQIRVNPLSSYIKYSVPVGGIIQPGVPPPVGNGFAYASILDNGYLKYAYILVVDAYESTNNSIGYALDTNITCPNTVELCIKWPDGKADTLETISDAYFEHDDTSFIKPVKCIYNNIIKYDITNADSVICDTTITASISGLPGTFNQFPTIVVEK
jgi:hypothetical protein